MTQKKHNWLLYALITMVTWGIWGAFSDQPDYPSTLTYVVWAISMVPCALVALANIKFKLDVQKAVGSNPSSHTSCLKIMPQIIGVVAAISCVLILSRE